MNEPLYNAALLASAAILAATLSTAPAAQQTTSPPSKQESAGQYMDDAMITTKVKSALMADSTTKASEIKVETDKGVVHLTGTVDNKAMVDKAADVARSVKGVQSVKNDLRPR